MTSLSEEYDPFLNELLEDQDAVTEACAAFASQSTKLSNHVRAVASSNDPNMSTNFASLDLRPDVASKSKDFQIRLEQVLSTLLNHLSSCKTASEYDATFVDVTQSLALLSRDELWAVAFTEKSILDFYLDLLQDAPESDHDWVEGAIKLIANCCTRSRRTQASAFPKAPIARLVDRLTRQATAAMSVKAISAIAGGHEYAMERLEQEYHLTSHLLQGLREQIYENADLDVLLDLIEDTTQFIGSKTLKEGDLAILGDIPAHYDIPDDRFSTIANLLIHDLPTSAESGQRISAHLQAMLQFFAHTFSEGDQSLLLGGPSEMHVVVKEGQDRGNESLRRLRTDLISKCGELAKFVQNIESLSAQISQLLGWMRILIPQAQIFGCVFLGNLIYHCPEHIKTLIEEFDVCDSLGHCIASGKDHGVLTSAFDLLQNIASAHFREELGKAGLLSSLEHHWQRTNYFSGKALYHTRQLLHDCPANGAMFVINQVSTAPEEPTYSLLSRMLDMYSQADDTTVRAEVGKVVAETWRTLEAGTMSKRSNSATNASHVSDNFLGKSNESPLGLVNDIDSASIDGGVMGSRQSPPSSNNSEMQNMTGESVQSNEHLLDAIFSSAQRLRVIEPVLGIVKSENETLRSQGWFTLSLMAQRFRGAAAVYDCCIENEENFALLEKTLLNPETHPALRSNAQYLVARLQEQFAYDSVRREVLDKLPPQRLAS